MRIGALAVAVGMLAGATQAQWGDAFDRPDGGLGNDWSVVNGSWGVQGSRGAHLSVGANEVAQHVQASGPYASSVVQLDVFAQNAGSQFSGVLIGLGGADTILVKLQDQDTSPGFSNIGIYHRTSATGWGSWAGAGSGFSTLQATFDSARLRVSFPDADTLLAELDTNFDGTIDQTYSRTGVGAFASALGTSYGLAAWGSTARFDNFRIDGLAIVSTYCTAGTSTSGCQASIAANAAPSASGATPCVLTLANVEGQKAGLFFYGLAPLPQPWCSNGASLLCVKAPTSRTPAQNSGGSVWQCNGSLQLDWNAFMAGHPGALGAPFSAGNRVFVQGWFRDPPSCKGTSLSNALAMTFAP
ncbi:MAG: hypothetical protein FJ298_07840 [Planctomycetes bacterium]|nr:hypothetical protein [Planctomycetota bacterium]